jgi:hypothetical protein
MRDANSFLSSPDLDDLDWIDVWLALIGLQRAGCAETPSGTIVKRYSMYFYYLT